jgi:hypothetical protein
MRVVRVIPHGGLFLSIALTASRPRIPAWNFCASVMRSWKTLRYRIGEIRTFGRYARRLQFAPVGGEDLTVILYGIPYGDWNAMLSDADIWRSLKGVREVRRVPAFSFLVPRTNGNTIVIPMKTEHALSAPRHCRGILPDPHALHVLGDKRAFAAYVADKLIDDVCPATYASADGATFPCVVKRVDLSGSMGVEIAWSRVQLDAILRSRLFAGRPSLLQEAVPGGVEYAATCICADGRVVWHWTFASTMSGPLVIKSEENDKNRRTVDASPDVLAQIERVLLPLVYSGPCVVNYKIDAGGAVRIFEINPRLGGSLLQRPQAHLLREALAHLLAAAR